MPWKRSSPTSDNALLYNHALDATGDTMTGGSSAAWQPRRRGTRKCYRPSLTLCGTGTSGWTTNRHCCSLITSLWNASSPQGEHVRQIVGSAGHAKARRAAMDAERRSNEFFRYYADQVDRPQGRALFEQFAKDEERHRAVIREAHDELRTHTGGL